MIKSEYKDKFSDCLSMKLHSEPATVSWFSQQLIPNNLKEFFQTKNKASKSLKFYSS